MMPNVAKMVPKANYKSIKYNCEGQLDAFAFNKDFSRVVVGGRSVFKVLSIKDDCFTEELNLRAGKTKANLKYSVSDVSWHSFDENVIASAATDGHVVIWNIGNTNKSKQERFFKAHTRSVNRVSFHPSHQNQLLSASEDGVVTIHDLRDPYPCISFGRQGTESVKDAQFCPPCMGDNSFAATFGHGVQIWDVRRPDRAERHFMAHLGFVYSIDWHPTERNKLATGGRDKMIKVWDLGVATDKHTPPPCVESIKNIYDVEQVKWRPHRPKHISSCTMLMENCVNVWDLRRPYIPFATFEGHTDSVKCIKWRDNAHTFLTCGRDNYIIQHIFSDAKRRGDNVNLSGLAISVKGDIGFAFSESGMKKSKKTKNLPRSQKFTMAHSSLCYFENCGGDPNDTAADMENLGADWLQDLVQFAQTYKLDSGSLVDTCLHNGNVAEQLGHYQVAQSWRILAATYSPSLDPTQTGSKLNSSLANGGQADRQDHLDKVSKLTKDKNKLKNSSQIQHHTGGTSDSSDGSSEFEGENSEVDPNHRDINGGSSFWFGDDGGIDDLSVECVNSAGMSFSLMEETKNDLKPYNIPYDMQTGRHDLGTLTEFEAPVMEETQHFASFANNHSARHASGDAESGEPTLWVKEVAKVEPIDLSSSVADIIQDYGEQGDVQTAVTMLVVLGERVRGLIDEGFEDSWFFSYIDLLGQFQEWTVANRLIKLSGLMAVSTQNQQSTTYHTLCGKCGRRIEHSAWLCSRCKQVSNACSLCHLPGKGLMVWCQGCGHGGHYNHIQQWASFSSKCAAGCGHSCEYT